jgi:hypothetical protein
VNRTISKTAIKAKLNAEMERDRLLFYNYDLSNPEALASKLMTSNDRFSIYLRSYCGQELSEMWNDKKTFKPQNYSWEKFDEYLINNPLYERKQFLKKHLAERNAEEFLHDMDRSTKIERCLIRLLNRSLNDKDLADKFRDLPEKIKSQIKNLDLDTAKMKPQDLAIFNRKLLKAAYRDEIGECLTEHELREILRKSVQRESTYNCARIYALDEKAHDALTMLRIALQKGDITPDDARLEPDFESIRRDPGFRSLLHKTYK